MTRKVRRPGDQSQRSIVLLIVLISPSLATATNLPQVGELHPDFRLPRIDTREAVSLSQFRGKKLLLIHFASW